MLLYMIESDIDPIQCIKYAEQYLREYPHDKMINWHIIAKVYLYSGNPDKAFEMLQKYAEYNNISSAPQYYGLLADVLEELHDYNNALNANRIFTTLIKKRDAARHLSDIKLVEERFENEIVQSRQKHITLYVTSISILLIFIILYMTVKWRIERRKSMSDLSDLQQEYDALVLLKERMEATYQYLSNQMTEASYTDQELMRVLGHRIKSLSAFLQKPIPDSLSKVASQIDDLKKNKNYIVDSIGLLYAVTYPDFVNELRAHDLTSSEIGLCCLYLLGLNIPEAGEVIGKVSSVYNVNSSIRKKIGVSGTNLDKWLVKCFAELHPSQICETANVNN